MGYRVGPLGRRQFLLRMSPGACPANFVQQEVPGAYLYTSPDLPVLTVAAPDGTPRFLLGVAADSSTGELSRGAPAARSLVTGRSGSAVEGTVAQQLATLTSAELEVAYREWSGRWVLIDSTELHLDAMGMLSVFWRNGAAASSPALLTTKRPEALNLHRELVLPFMPGPVTGLDGVQRLLPCQVLSWQAWRTRTRELMRVHQVQENQAPQLLEELGERLLASIEQAARLGPVVVPLTAGYDSRLALAACVRLGLQPRLVTQAYRGMTRADLALPPVMAERLGLEHETVRPGPPDHCAGDLYDAQVGGLVRETDRIFFQRRQFAWLQTGDVVLRGVAFDGTRRALHRVLDDVPLESGALARALGADPVQEGALAEWVELVKADPQGLSVHDRFWIDQKCASYAATTELALDLLGAHSVVPGNSTIYQELALSLPWSWRRESYHHTTLVARWAPLIAELPYNPPRRGLEKLARAGGAVRRRLRARAARRRGA